jgi:hypothetical protein
MEVLDEWVMWNLVLVRLETVFVLVQYRCTVCAEHTIGSKSFWTHPMILLGDEAQVEACLSPFGDSGNLDARKVRCLCQMYHRLGNRVRMHPMELLGEWVMWNLVSVRLEIVLVSVQDRCAVCAKCAIGS